MTGGVPTQGPQGEKDGDNSGQASWWAQTPSAATDSAQPTVRVGDGAIGGEPQMSWPQQPGVQQPLPQQPGMQPAWPQQPGTQPAWPQQPGPTGLSPQQLPTGQSPQPWPPQQQVQQSWPQPPMVPPPYPAAPTSGGTAKAIGTVLGCLVIVALVAVIAVVAIRSGHHHNSANANVSTETTTDDPSPTTYSTPPTTPPFDWTTLDNASTDQTPITASALLPQSFTDSKGVLYNRVASGEQPCVTRRDSANVARALNQNHCTTNMSGSFVDKDDHILVSLNVLVFPDAAAAQAAYGALSGPTQDWEIWCPTTGIGSSACDGDVTAATTSQWSSLTHRYFIQATGLYINLTNDSSVNDWVSAGAHQAVQEAGPQVYQHK